MPDGTYGGVRGQVGDITLTFLLDLTCLIFCGKTLRIFFWYKQKTPLNLFSKLLMSFLFQSFKRSS
jgi:hypothetical protein